MKTLIQSTGSFDQVNTFAVLHRGRKMTCKLERDYHKDGDGIYWFMQVAGCIKARYTEADRAETARLQEMTPILDGEVVLIEGAEYVVKVNGDYSDAAILSPL